MVDTRPKISKQRDKGKRVAAEDPPRGRCLPGTKHPKEFSGLRFHLEVCHNETIEGGVKTSQEAVIHGV